MSVRRSEKVRKSGFSAERRDAPRFPLLMRTAKLLCESGEYICMVRDVSAGGAMIRLFHEVPPDTHVFLELASGDRYAMQRRWHRKDRAGYRFSSRIAVNEFIEEPSIHPRRPLRLRLYRTALVTADGRDSKAMLRNISQQGACVETSSRLSEGTELRLEVAGLPIRFGTVRWQSERAYGVVFQQAFPLEDFARYTLALQPFDAEAGDPDEARDVAPAICT